MSTACTLSTLLGAVGIRGKNIISQIRRLKTPVEEIWKERVQSLWVPKICWILNCRWLLVNKLGAELLCSAPLTSARDEISWSFKMKYALFCLNQNTVCGINLYKRSSGTKSFAVRERIPRDTTSQPNNSWKIKMIMTFSLWDFLLTEIFFIRVLYLNGMINTLEKVLPLELGPSWFHKDDSSPKLWKTFWFSCKKITFWNGFSLSNFFSLMD